MDNKENPDVHEQKVQTLIKRKIFFFPFFFINIDWGKKKQALTSKK